MLLDKRLPQAFPSLTEQAQGLPSTLHSALYRDSAPLSGLGSQPERILASSPTKGQGAPLPCPLLPKLCPLPGPPHSPTSGWGSRSGCRKGSG